MLSLNKEGKRGQHPQKRTKLSGIRKLKMKAKMIKAHSYKTSTE